MDEAGTWQGRRPQPRRLCIRWGPSPFPQKGAEPHPQFSAHFYCGQTAACIKMPLRMELGLGPGDFVLDGDPAPPRGTAPIFGPHLLRPNGCMEQDVTWYGARPRPRRLCVRWEPSPLPPKGGGAPSPIFGPFLLWPNSCMHQNATWYGARPRPMRLCVRWGSRCPFAKRGADPQNFQPMFIVTKRLDG